MKIPELDNPWYQSAQTELSAALARSGRTGTARNVIFFIGDGMSLSTVTAARILEGQIQGS
ncbi:MAG: alkaline phosphatase, partial [Gammaproteobacteria bacterium]|nr:alkaline phosphatase [Gammaproteobacteria bacterium]